MPLLLFYGSSVFTPADFTRSSHLSYVDCFVRACAFVFIYSFSLFLRGVGFILGAENVFKARAGSKVCIDARFF